MAYALSAHVLLIVAFVYLISRRYRSIVHPVAYFAAFYALQTAAAPLLLRSDNREYFQIETVAYSALYFVCIAVPFLIRTSPFRKPLRFAQTALLPREPNPSRFTYVAFAMEFVLLFAILIATSGTTEWLSSPRSAYQSHRTGVGVWWALSEGALTTLLVSFLVGKKRGPIATITACALISFVAYFLGSKSYMLCPFILAILYYNYSVRSIPRWVILVAVVGALVGISALQILQGTAQSISDTIDYFNYFDNTTQFLEAFGDRFQFTWGANWLSSFWAYVPRGLYPDKPLVYGIAVIMEDFQPGAAELGSTSGILPWAASYLDFGALGVAVEGLLIGFATKALFENFLERPSMVSLLMVAQFGLQISPPVYSAPLPLFWLWLVAQVSVANLALMARNDACRYLRQARRPRLAFGAS
jgi:oligosaccharide repeat unit polymerase